MARVLAAHQPNFLPWLGYLDSKQRKVTGGLAEEMVNRLVAIGKSWGIRVCPKHLSAALVHPEYAKVLAIELCREAGVEVLLHCESVNVNVENGRIVAVSVQGKGTRVDIRAKVFIDGTGDGDVGYMAGAAFEKGHGENAELQPPTCLFTLGNVELPRLFDYLDEHPDDHEFPVDYYRSEPSHIFVGLAGLYRRLREQGELPVTMPALIYTKSFIEGQVYINGVRLVGTDASDLNSLTKAELDGHLQVTRLIAMLQKHVPGFEQCSLVGINATLGVRETRRLIGRKYLTVDKALAYDIPADTIALAAFMIDIHSGKDHHSRFTKLDGPFGIPYLTLVSRDIENLMMVGRCISMDYEVTGSARVMATCMATGEAAGIGAALAVKQNVDPAQVSHEEARAALRAGGAVLAV